MPGASADYQREYRRRRRANGGARLTVPVAGEAVRCEPEPDPPIPSDAAGAVARWSAERLKVPPGHPRAGEPMALPPFLEKFFCEASAPGVRESGMFCGRKNSKSGGLGIWILAHLADDGPLRRRGWRCGAASLSREKAAELWTQIVDIAAASGLDEIRSGKVPRHVSSAWGRCEFPSAERTAGHASGFDLVIADELGLFPERGRDLVAGLLSSTSARDGRLIAISVIGDSPLSREMIERAGDPATVAHVYQAAKDAALDDPAAWAAANPGLGSIKSRSYMADMARRAGANPAEAASFRVYDLNLPGSASREMIVTLDRWLLVEARPRPDREGPCFVGFDLGGSSSLTAAALYWPAVGRLEVYGAVGDDPDLAARGEADGVGGRYERMAERGELRTWPGRVTPCGPFLGWIAEVLDGAAPTLAVADPRGPARRPCRLAAGGVGEGLTPLGEGPVGGDYGGVLLAAAGDDVEQQIGMAVAVGQVSDLVDHQQVLAGVEAQPALKQGVAVEGGELAEHAGRGGEAHGVALEDGAVGDIGGDGRLADAVWADQDDVGGLVEELEALSLE